jgi:hypothetical protein
MGVRLFALGGVPYEEAEAIRELLHRNKIPFYETPKTKWGFSAQAIYLPNDEHNDRARDLIDEYQEKLRRSIKRQEPVRNAWGQRTGLRWFKDNPQLALAGIALILLILALMFMPIITMIRM